MVHPASTIDRELVLQRKKVKKSLEFDYPPPKAVAFRRINGFAIVISIDSLGIAINTLPHAEHVDFRAELNLSGDFTVDRRMSDYVYYREKAISSI